MLRAQTLHGTLREAGSGAPIEGAMVVLIDETGRDRSGTLTGPDGRFLIAAPHPGTFRLRADRIGYRSTHSGAMPVGAGASVGVPLEAPLEPIALQGIDVRAERRCVVRPGEGREVRRVWEEARKALAAAAWTDSSGLYRYDVELFRRQRTRDARRVLRDSTARQTRLTTSPFVSRPPEELAAEGYVRTDPGGTTFYAPDASVLLSEPFLDGHCFRLRAGHGETDGLLGLEFEPVGRVDRPDVRGVLWMDPAAAELRRLDYGYTNLAVAQPAALGGRVEFARLAGGGWYVRRWWIRWPTVSESVGTDAWREHARTLTEVGAEVTGVTPTGLRTGGR